MGSSDWAHMVTPSAVDGMAIYACALAMSSRVAITSQSSRMLLSSASIPVNWSSRLRDLSASACAISFHELSVLLRETVGSMAC